MSAITTHVLDTARGCPATGLLVALEHADELNRWIAIGEGVTDADGRLRSLMAKGSPVAPGPYRLVFDTATYFAEQNIAAFYPHIIVTFTVTEDRHYHVPLLLSPFGYSTYRGS